MLLQDPHQLPFSGAAPASIEFYRQALRQFQCYIEDPVASLDAALAETPGFAMAHAFKAYLNLLGTEPLGLAPARDSLHAAQRTAGTARERGHVSALEHLLQGRWHAAGRVLEDLSIDYPHDALALQAGHLIDFYTGNARMLRDRIARALPAWSVDAPGYHAVLGMHAFGLEESGDYTRAEHQGRRAVELEPRDGWAQHAVAHVMEMQNRQREGITWMRANPAAWSTDSFFQVHLWWHLALYHLDLGDTDAALELFDGPIHGARSPIVLDMIDASALLWRLHLRGVQVGARWETVADGWTPISNAGNYAFNDVHAAMAFVGARRTTALDALIAAQQEAMSRADDNAAFTREVGHPVTLALRAFGDGDYASSIAHLRGVREIAHRFGGSHAQRDILDLTLIEAALRGNQHALAHALCAERASSRADNPHNATLMRRANAAGLYATA